MKVFHFLDLVQSCTYCLEVVVQLFFFFLHLGAADLEIKVACAGNSELSGTSSVTPRLGQNTALNASSAARNSAFVHFLPSQYIS